VKLAAYLGGVLGLALLIVLVLRADSAAMLHTLGLAGWRLLWLVPYRILFYLLYAVGWLILLQPCDPQRRAGLGYLLWVTTVREGIDRLLPVASVGGGVIAVRMLRWRGLSTAPVAASVIVEVLLTLIVAYLFTAVGLLVLVHLRATGVDQYRHLVAIFVLSLPVPVTMALLLRYGSVFKRLEGILQRMVVVNALAGEAELLDRALRASLRRGWSLVRAGSLQFAAFMSGAFEVWLALRLFGHPVGVTASLVLESMTQAVRHLAFIIPAGLGVQEAGLMVFGQIIGISGELALAVSMAKRLREVLCGLPALLSWQWVEARRLRSPS
jgi:putative membrane protein